MQYRFAVNFGTLSIRIAALCQSFRVILDRIKTIFLKCKFDSKSYKSQNEYLKVCKESEREPCIEMFKQKINQL